MAVFVTGATGLVGAHLLIELVKQGEQVKALHRSGSNLKVVEALFDHYGVSSHYNRVTWVQGNLMDVMSLVEGMNGCNKVYHCAAYVSFDPKDESKLMQFNIDGTANVVNACLSENISKLCYVSSTAALGRNEKEEEITENTPWKSDFGNSKYSISKHYAEREVWRGVEEGLDVVIVNPCIIVGPGNWGQSSTNMFNQVWKGLKYYTKGANAFVDVRDVSRVMYKLMESEIKSEQYLLIGENMPYRAFFDLVAEALNKQKPVKLATSFMSGIAWRVEKIRGLLTGSSPLITKETARSANTVSVFSNKKIVDLLGYQFTPIAQSVKDTATVFLKQH